MKKLLCLAVLAIGCGASHGAVSADDWGKAMLVRRAAFQQNAVAAESGWWMTAPLKATFSEALFPEQGVDLQAKDERNRARWTARRNIQNGAAYPFDAPDGTSTYFYRTLEAKAAGKLQLSFGSDDGLEVWFNGQKVISKDVPRTISPDQDALTVELRPGKNELLVKIYNRTGSAGMYYASGDDAGATVISLARQFPEEIPLFKRYMGEGWFSESESSQIEQNAIQSLIKRLKQGGEFQARLTHLSTANTAADNPAWLALFLDAARVADGFGHGASVIGSLNTAALRRAIDDLVKTYPDQYKNGRGCLAAIDGFDKDLAQIRAGLEAGDPAALKRVQEIELISRKALLENPALDFDKILFVKRNESNLALAQNWQGNSSLNPVVENEMATLVYKDPSAPIQTLYKSKENRYVGDICLNYEADKLLFSSIGTQNHWQVFEIKTDGSALRQVTKGDEPDVDNYNAIYLPDKRIIYISSATFQGVPCVGGADYVGNLFLMNEDGTHVRRLCFDQDNDWYPSIMSSGRVIYTRWEYTDSAHYFSRLIMSMNPDGTGQSEVYGANSYWPNSTFYARTLPGSDSKFVGIISGHHGVPRMGEMVVFDAAKGRIEDTGAMQRITGFGKPVKGPIKDQLVDDSWPKFLHPYPINDKYFLAAAKPTAQSRWGIYLVDIFDNMTLLKEEPGYAMLEPVALRPSTRPPIIPDKVNLGDTNATVVVQDIYSGDGLRGVPRGQVKSLRVYQYEYSYRNQGGHYFVGMEGPWDVRRIIGTVPVNEDGSAMFNIPANTPIALQPLDAEGKALQLMRSWFVGMPGEFISCVGCHEKQNQSASMGFSAAAKGAPLEIKPWLGAKRGFNFLREVQPVLDKYCVGCHDGKHNNRPNFSDVTITHTTTGSPLPQSYLALHPWVRRNGPEGDYHTLTPLEFHADTSLLIQLLRKGHYNVKLDAEGWDRLITWIDLNVPAYGTYSEISRIPSNFQARRYESRIKNSGVDEDIEAYPTAPPPRGQYVKPDPMAPKPARVTLADWPLAADRAARMQADLGATDMKIDLGNSVSIALKKIPAGEFAMGDVAGEGNEYPMAAVKVAQSFYIALTEITLQQYQQFDPSHKNGYYDQHYKDQVRPGYLMDTSPQFPVIRISWEQAMEFCKWLSAKSGRKVTLPTEAQWEWACRAGTDTPYFYGDLNTDFGTFANLADATVSKMAVSGVDPQPIANPDKFWDYLPKEARFNDGVLHLADVAHYKCNAWGLHDMIGNVGEWTLDTYRPYPYSVDAAKNDAAGGARKVVRGGSWSERPRESRASSRLDYPAWQRVYNVGFRVIVEE